MIHPQDRVRETLLRARIAINQGIDMLIDAVDQQAVTGAQEIVRAQHDIAEPLLTYDDATTLLAVHRDTLTTLVRQNRVPHIIVPSATGSKPSIRFRASELQSWLDETRDERRSA